MLHRTTFVTALWGSLAYALPSFDSSLLRQSPALIPRVDSSSSANTSICAGNSASDRSVWCDYSTSTNYYDEVPDTGRTIEYWLELTNITAAPDGIERIVLAVNGSVPGPTIEANWGDTVKVHVINNFDNNGTRYDF